VSGKCEATPSFRLAGRRRRGIWATPAARPRRPPAPLSPAAAPHISTPPHTLLPHRISPKSTQVMVAAKAVHMLIAGVLLQTPAPTTSFGCPPPERLRRLLQATGNGDAPILLLPCCYDGLTARLVGLSGFNATFMTGFGVSGANGYPDTQLVSFNEMLSAANSVAEGLSSAALELAKYGEAEEGSCPPIAIPCIADGDTGYGNAINVKRTVFGYARVGMAGMMIEDQVAPKRCGHVAGKSVVPFADAVKRVQAACDAR
jgi:hypothetical protein